MAVLSISLIMTGYPLDLTCYSAAMIACRDAANGRAPTSLPIEVLQEKMLQWRSQETMIIYNTEVGRDNQYSYNT